MDPSGIIAKPDHRPLPPDLVDVQTLLERQLRIASSLQEAILAEGSNIGPKDLKDLASTASTVIGLSYKTEQLLTEISTLRLFSQVVLEFLRNRSDTLGEDLLAELREVAKGLNASDCVP